MTKIEYVTTFVMEVLMDSLSDLTADYAAEYTDESALMLDEEFEKKEEEMRVVLEKIREKLNELY